MMTINAAYDWDIDRKAGRRGGTRGSKLMSTFGQGLRETYRDVLEQGVPDTLLPLIRRLEERDRQRGLGADG